MFDHISLIVICCHFATAIGHSDCGQLEQCITDSQENIWCSLFNSALTNDLAIMKINESISNATIDDGDVKIYWNTHTQGIVLKVQTHDNQAMTPLTASFGTDTQRLSESKRFRHTCFSRRE